MKYLIGTDIGTSGTKTILMNTAGELIAQDLEEYDVITRRPLWAEQWPDVWYEALCTSIRKTVKKAGVAPESVAGLCISGLYGGSGIPLDKDMRPVRPCLIWMDRRAGEQEKWVVSHVGTERIKQITHNGTDPYYGYTKILWIRDNEPENWDRIRLFLPPNAYAIYRLTGETAIDYSSAGNLGGVFDMNTRTWSKELLTAMDIPYTMMPERLCENTEIIGRLSAESGKMLGLPEGLPVFNGGVDCGAATLGMGVFEPGEYAAAIGTSMCGALIHADPIAAKDLIEWPYVYRPKELAYSFGGSATAGAVVKWFRNTFAAEELAAEKQGGENAYAVLDRQAEKIRCGSEGLVVLPYFMGERSPIWDTNAKGTIFGLSLIHTKAHIYRAFLEAVAYSLRHTMESCGTPLKERILLAGGVSKSPLWRQIFADVTGHSVVCPKNDVEANLGDVMLAALGTGLLTEKELVSWQTLRPEVRPDPAAHEKYNRYYAIYRRLYMDLKQDMKAISEY
ncbi:MAG: FGGY-family carbohydrate kinase [Clostridiales bacterium]|nr:FGGY-family carbohydrate kinase [Clostridiales bacterium]